MNTPRAAYAPFPAKKQKIDAQELLLSSQPGYVCETYIFEPSGGEEALGYLFAAAETEDRDGVGKELVDVVISAIQREYFRDRQRGAVQSFESALHQANLILHDASERGVRDWMGYFHVAVGALSGKQLHVSVAGQASVWMARKQAMSCISEGLSHLPITNPLRTFSQVASGAVSTRDVALFATGSFGHVFRPEDIARFTIDHSAATISARMQQLYNDQQNTAPLAVVAVAVLPDYVVQSRQEASTPPPRSRGAAIMPAGNLKPRKPLIIRKAGWQTMFLALSQSVHFIWRAAATHAWPHIKTGSRVVGVGLKDSTGALLSLSRKAGPLASAGIGNSLGRVRRPHLAALPSAAFKAARTLPFTSKVFGMVALLLVVVLVFSLRSLQDKRALDQDIQRAAELLHEAQVKEEAAEAALIYDNRDQGKALLEEAQKAAASLAASGFYEAETRELNGKIETQLDRLQRIARIKNAAPVGDFAAQVGGEVLKNIFLVGDMLYTFNPATNAILALSAAGEVLLVSEQTKEIGFFQNGVVHVADKTILLATSDGLALFDTKDNSLARQEIALPAGQSSIGPMALFGNRLYRFDSPANNILTYNKTLRGFSGGTPWIVDPAFEAETIKSLTVDGSIYTLHKDGSIKRLFKGAGTDFTLDTIEPSLASATKIVTSEEFSYIYILDPDNKRVAVLTKKGALLKQLFFEAQSLKDFAIDQKEENLYALDGTKVFKVSLTEQVK